MTLRLECWRIAQASTDPVASSWCLLPCKANLSWHAFRTSGLVVGRREWPQFGRQRCTNPIGTEQFMCKSFSGLRRTLHQAGVSCAGRLNCSITFPKCPSLVDLLKMVVLHKLCNCIYFVLCCVYGASGAMITAGSSPVASHSLAVEQLNHSSWDIIFSGGRYSRLLVVPLSPIGDSSRLIRETANNERKGAQRRVAMSRSTMPCELEKPGLVRLEEKPHSSVSFVGIGPGRRRKSNSFVKSAANRVGPAVVRLDTERDFPTGEQEVVENRDHLFRQWFGETELQVPRKFRRERGQGSGFVFDGHQGMIVTNAHVVKGADRVKVTFTDGRSFEGEVAGTDDITDIALIKVPHAEGDILPTALLGDSRTVELGDWVIAVGNPFGLDNTVSLGIISNLHRTAAEVGIPDKRLDFLQTDCAINPGNSGGPLVNEFGEVIGINTAIRADAEGISFAIPINKARKIMEALGQGKPVEHPFLGVQMATLSVDLARHYNADPNTGVPITEAQGVLIVKVSPDSPAAIAGLRSGDVIVRVDGVDMSSSVQLQRLVEGSAVGQALHLVIWRGDKSLEVVLETGDMAPYFGKNGPTGNPNGCFGKNVVTNSVVSVI